MQHSDWLTQLNLKALDEGDGSNSCLDTVSSKPKAKQGLSFLTESSLESRGFVNRLRSFFSHRSEYSEDVLMTIQTELMKDAMHLQSKAEKSDLLFKMVEDFNNNTIHVTITWQLVNNIFGRNCSFVSW